MPTPSLEATASFLAFLDSQSSLDREVAVSEFRDGLWVQSHGQWVHRSTRKEKYPTNPQWRERNGPFDPVKHGDSYRES